MGPDEVDYSVSFSIPANAPGVKVINRSYAEPGLAAFDYPASGRANMPEGFVIFDDVFVPWERVFLAGEWQLAGVLAHSLGLWERVGGLLAAVEESQVLVGMCQLLTEYNGISKASHIQEKISELICYAEVIRHSLECATRNYESTESGMVYPNTMDVNVGKYYFAANYHQMIRHVHDIAGGLVVTMPHEGDLRSEETGPYLRKYLHTRDDVDIEDRMKLYNLIRDRTADAYGGWSLVTNIQAGGGLAAQKIVMNRSYDLEHAKSLAKEAAGIAG
jgi:4-hydroxybutyryl-CoA dehydratase/vinylacetyl-CoA-Delta-isomerase